MSKYTMTIDLTAKEETALEQEFAASGKTVQSVLNEMVVNSIKVQCNQWIKDIAKREFEKLTPIQALDKLKK